MSQHSIRGSIKVALIGGPLDGAQYGDLPDPGKPTASVRLSIPLSQPADTSVRAIYICTHTGSPAETWEFRFHRLSYPKFPTGTQVSFT